jgi:hypothetical protein
VNLFSFNRVLGTSMELLGAYFLGVNLNLTESSIFFETRGFTYILCMFEFIRQVSNLLCRQFNHGVRR